MSIDDLIANFHSILKNCLPSLMKAGVTIGTDEWDDFVELVFDIVVTTPVESLYSRKVVWCFGSWPETVGEKTPYVAEVGEGAPLLVGKRNSTMPISRVDYGEVRPATVALKFALRDFSHPFIEDEAGTGIDYVSGEVVDGGQQYPVGTNICVPFQVCRFDIR